MIEAFFQSIDFQTSPANSWFVLLLIASLVGASIVVIGFALERTLVKNVSSKFLYCVWMLVLLRDTQ